MATASRTARDTRGAVLHATGQHDRTLSRRAKQAHAVYANSKANVARSARGGIAQRGTDMTAASVRRRAVANESVILDETVATT